MMPPVERLVRIETTLEIILKRLDEDREFHRVQTQIAQDARERVRLELERLGRDTSQLNEWRKEVADPFITMGTSIKAKIAGIFLALGIVGGVVLAGMNYFKEAVIRTIGL